VLGAWTTSVKSISKKQDIWKSLEDKRFQQLKHAAVNLQSDMFMNQSRCPKCTLQPPCRHYGSVQEMMVTDVSHFLHKPMFKQHLSPRKRDFILRTVRDTQQQIEFTARQSD
jgi:hypothetical protein